MTMTLSANRPVALPATGRQRIACTLIYALVITSWGGWMALIIRAAEWVWVSAPLLADPLMLGDPARVMLALSATALLVLATLPAPALISCALRALIR